MKKLGCWEFSLPDCKRLKVAGRVAVGIPAALLWIFFVIAPTAVLWILTLGCINGLDCVVDVVERIGAFIEGRPYSDL